MEGRTAYRQHMTVFWSRAQHHVTTSLMKLAVGERNVATNFRYNFRLCYRILFQYMVGFNVSLDRFKVISGTIFTGQMTQPTVS